MFWKFEFTASTLQFSILIIRYGNRIYGLLRFGSTILPYGILYLSPLIFLWTLVGCFTCSYNCLRQYDLKKIIAYSSVTHINFAIASLYTLHIQGLMGCIINSYKINIVDSKYKKIIFSYNNKIFSYNNEYCYYLL